MTATQQQEPEAAITVMSEDHEDHEPCSSRDL